MAAAFQFSRSELQIDFRSGHRSEPVMNKKETHERVAIMGYPSPETIGVSDYQSGRAVLNFSVRAWRTVEEARNQETIRRVILRQVDWPGESREDFGQSNERWWRSEDWLQCQPTG